jgi:hypothetical protein
MPDVEGPRRARPTRTADLLAAKPEAENIVIAAATAALIPDTPPTIAALARSVGTARADQLAAAFDEAREQATLLRSGVVGKYLAQGPEPTCVTSLSRLAVANQAAGGGDRCSHLTGRGTVTGVVAGWDLDKVRCETCLYRAIARRVPSGSWPACDVCQAETATHLYLTGLATLGLLTFIGPRCKATAR